MRDVAAIAHSASSPWTLFPYLIGKKLLFVFQQIFKVGKGLVCRWSFGGAVGSGCPIKQIFLVLMVMTVQAENFPVAPVRRVIFVVVVLMVDGEFAKRPAFKRPSTPAAHMRKELECLLAVAQIPHFPGAPRLCD